MQNFGVDFFRGPLKEIGVSFVFRLFCIPPNCTNFYSVGLRLGSPNLVLREKMWGSIIFSSSNFMILSNNYLCFKSYEVLRNRLRHDPYTCKYSFIYRSLRNLVEPGDWDKVESVSKNQKKLPETRTSQQYPAISHLSAHGLTFRSNAEVARAAVAWAG